MIEYTIRIDNDVEIAEVVEFDSRYEIPLPSGLSQEEQQVIINNEVEKIKLHNYLATGVNLMISYKDNAYMNGELVRTDINVTSNEADNIINQLVTEFPHYTIENIKSNSNNIIGTYGNYRPPYNNNSISLYYFEEPSIDLLNTYHCTDIYNGILRSWYGLKHDLVTKNISAKIVFSPENYQSFFINPPNIEDTGGTFFARIHNTDGSVSEWVDMYVFKTNTQMRSYCEQIGKPFPLPNDITQQCWLFSIVFNDVTGEINNVKGYIRNN